MLRFFRESIKEFDHVVWPTRRETVRYFTVVVSTIVVFSIFLFVVGTAFSTSLFSLREMVSPTASTPQVSNAAPDIDIGSLLATGSTSAEEASATEVSE